MKRVPPESILNEHRDIFVKVTRWGSFQYSDIKGNDILQAKSKYTGDLPAFVTEFHGKLERKPILGQCADSLIFPHPFDIDGPV
jgi:hypothetical protein